MEHAAKNSASRGLRFAKVADPVARQDRDVTARVGASGGRGYGEGWSASGHYGWG